MPVANNVDIVIKHIRVSYTDSFGYECLIEAVLPSSFRCLVSFDQALLSGEVKKGIVTSQDVEIDAYNPLSYQPAASIMVKADKNDRSMLLASGLALEKAKKAKVASLCLATTAGVRALKHRVYKTSRGKRIHVRASLRDGPSVCCCKF